MSHLITVITISNVANVIIFVYLEYKYSHGDSYGDPHREKIFPIPIPIPWVWKSPWVFPFPRQLWFPTINTNSQDSSNSINSKSNNLLIRVLTLIILENNKCLILSVPLKKLSLPSRY